jgi:hypothetical protein
MHFFAGHVAPHSRTANPIYSFTLQELSMSILGNIFNKIFHHDSSPAQATAPASPAAPAAPAAPVTPATTAQAAPAGAAAPMAEVDVAALLNGLAQKSGQALNWRTSIVDLLKLLDLDSSLTARKELAQELQYSGDTGDSAAMNIWLHKQVMNKLAANGGKVPADLKD